MPILTFEKMWGRSRRIPGHFTQKSARQLYRYAMCCEPSSEFVEIGAWCGRSASILGQVAMTRQCRLTLVDSFAMPPSAIVLVYSLRNLDIAFELMAMPSAQAAPLFTRPIALLHIDGDHEAIEQDCALWLPKLKVGGIAMFHDWGQGHRLIKRIVDALEGYENLGTFDSLAIRRKL